MVRIWEQYKKPDFAAMLAHAENHLLHHGIAEFLPDMVGNVVELGPWLGGSTVALNKYVRPELREQHYAFDRFLWISSYMDGHLRTYGRASPYKHYESFQTEFQENTRGCANLHTTQCNLQDFKFPDMGEIKLLFIDAFKQFDISCNCLPQLLPALRQGALVLDQDFLYKPVFYMCNHVFMFRLRAYLKPVVVASAMVGFQVQQIIPRHVVEDAVRLEFMFHEYIDMGQYWLTTLGEVTL